MRSVGAARAIRIGFALLVVSLVSSAGSVSAADPSAAPGSSAVSGFPGADLVSAFVEFIKAAATNPLGLVAGVLIIVGVFASVSTRARSILLALGLILVALVVGTNYLGVVRSNEHAFDRARAVYESRLRECQIAMGTVSDLLSGKLEEISTPEAARILAEQMRQVIIRSGCLDPLPSGPPGPTASPSGPSPSVATPSGSTPAAGGPSATP